MHDTRMRDVVRATVVTTSIGEQADRVGVMVTELGYVGAW